jgi:hypothetical protein
LIKEFSGLGDIQKIHFPSSEKVNYAFVEYKSSEDAKNAVSPANPTFSRIMLK